MNHCLPQCAEKGLINYLELDNYTTTFLPKLDILVQEINTLYERTRRKTATDPKKEEEFTKDLTSFNTNINLCITEMMKLKETINLYMNYMISLCRTREVKTKNFSHIIEEEEYAILKKEVPANKERAEYQWYLRATEIVD